MAYSSIVKPSVHFNTKLYTGNSSTNAITGVGFQPDWVWIKNRGANDSHYLYDAVRGVTKSIYSNLTSAEATKSNGLTAFGTDGFTLGNEGDINGNGNNFVSWNWKAGTGQGSSNTDGSINTTYTSVNTTAGFSISSYTGNGSAGATIGHGLGVVPKMIIVKKLNGSPNWAVYHASLSSHAKYLELNLNSAEQTDSGNFDNVPTSSTFLVGSDNKVNSSGDTYVAYCFAEKKGYSKFGTYTGNGNADGTFVYTGFSPSFFLIKRTDATNNWRMWDNKRDPFNVRDTSINANEVDAEYTNASIYIDFVSNGVKFRSTSDNVSSGNYIYMAFAEEPLVANSGTDGVPATAR